jgi:ferredoxin
MVRMIIKVDDEKCDGCGLCIPARAEWDLQIVEEKASV